MTTYTESHARLEIAADLLARATHLLNEAQEQIEFAGHETLASVLQRQATQQVVSVYRNVTAASLRESQRAAR